MVESIVSWRSVIIHWERAVNCYPPCPAALLWALQATTAAKVSDLAAVLFVLLVGCLSFLMCSVKAPGHKGRLGRFFPEVAVKGFMEAIIIEGLYCILYTSTYMNAHAHTCLCVHIYLGGCAQKRATQAAAGIYLIFSAS